MWESIKRIESSDSNVSKYVFNRQDAVAESVLYKYPTYQERTVICCSTQSGCPVGCRFCGAGDNFVRSLSADEIVSQPVKLIEDTGIDAKDMNRLQIMFMSMGEPMLNLNGLIPALYSLHNSYPNAALLVSTSGPRIDYAPFINVSKEISTIGLQFSYILIMIGWNFFDLQSISIRYKFFDTLIWISALLLLGQIVFLITGVGLAEKWWK